MDGTLVDSTDGVVGANEALSNYQLPTEYEPWRTFVNIVVWKILKN